MTHAWLACADGLVERPKQVGIAFNQFEACAKAWAAIKSPKRRAFHLFSLLTGCRPNEAAMLKWQDVDCRRRVIVFGNTKAGADVTIPMTREIAAALRIVPKPRDKEWVGVPVLPQVEREGQVAQRACAAAHVQDGRR